MLAYIFLSSVVFSSFSLAPAETARSEFVFANENEPETIDPQITTGVPDNNVAVQIFEGLMMHGPDWVSLLPGQAEKIPSPKENGTLYTFTLRKGLKWSDGSPLTAEDFRWSWLRAMRPETLGPYAYWLTDNIVGAKEYAASPTKENEAKVGLKVLDDRHFQVKLNKPVPYFLHLTAETVMFPVPRKQVEKFGDKWTRPENILCNGPYVLTDWSLNQKIELKKNPLYWDSKNVKIENVKILPLNDKQTVVNLFRQGRLDWSGHNGAPNSLVPGLKNDPNFKVYPSFITYFYRFNTKRPPLDDRRVRQALALAINRGALVEKVTRGGELPATALVPPKTGTYESPIGVVSGNFEKDLNKAKALLVDYMKEKGVKNLRKLRLQYDTKELHKRIAQAIQEMWRKNLGVEIEVYNQEWKVYLAAQRNMEFDISRSGWMGDYPDAATFLELFTASSGNNHTGFANPNYDQLFEASAAESKASKRMKLLRQTEEILLTELPIVPLFYYTNFGFLRPEVQGFVPNLVDRPYIRFLSKN